MIILITILTIVLISLITLWVIYNSLVKAQNIVEEAVSGIDVQLKKRFELIPSLVEAVKAYNSYEAELLSKIVDLRSGNNEGLDAKMAKDYSLTQGLKHFRIQIENYPDLKANSQFLKLMDSLSTIENELSMSRRYYNGTARDMNNKIEVFPNVMFSRIFGFKEVKYYEIENLEEKNIPNIDLS